MAFIRKRGNSYLIIVSRGYDYQGNRIRPAQKTVHPPQDLTAKQTEKWLNEQAVLYEMEVKHAAPVDRSITLAKYIDIWLEQVAPKKLAISTLTRDKQDIRRILPKLGHYKLADLNKDILRDFYEDMRAEQNWKNGELLAEKTVEGIHSCLPGRHDRQSAHPHRGAGAAHQGYHQCQRERILTGAHRHDHHHDL